MIQFNILHMRNKFLFILNHHHHHHHQLTFSMNYYNDRKKLISYGKRLTISPDFIILDNGRYYVVGCFENKNDEKKNLAIIRIDLMSDIRILKDMATSMYDVPSLRQVSKDKFRSCHLPCRTMVICLWR